MMGSCYAQKRLAREKVFRDPVHNYIHVQHQVILDLINSSEFQRLRRIKQLGTTSFVFHGGEHSRFSHSLGVYEISRRICDIFTQNFPKAKFGAAGWDDQERLLTLCAALLHDIGHGPYSHTFEHIFQTDHEALTVSILTSPATEVYQILNQVAPNFPQKVASVIQKTYANPQVVQLISSQIDADRMDYLLRDAYFTGTEYGTFDLTRILRVIRPYPKGIAYQYNGMHSVEDYIVSRYQMYMQVYFHPVSRGMEVILDHLLKRASELYQTQPELFQEQLPFLLPFLNKNFSLQDYLHLDDGVLNTIFQLWMDHPDPVLSDLAQRFMNRKPLKSVTFNPKKQMAKIAELQQLVEKVGYYADYYTAINSSYDLPYDFYRPNTAQQKTQIELIQDDGSLLELSQVSDLVAALAGEIKGDERFYFPKEMLVSATGSTPNLFEKELQLFSSYLHNGQLK